jgi:hypothetical protein
MVMQGEYTRVYPGSDKEGPTSSGVEEYYICLHRSAYVEVTSYERGNWTQVSREEKGGVLLEMLIAKVERTPVLCLFLFLRAHSPPLL